MCRFDPNKYYAASDPGLELLGSYQALAQQRSRGEGPRYHKVGRRIFYRGDDLNEYLDRCVVEPTRGPAGPRSDGLSSGAPAAAA